VQSSRRILVLACLIALAVSGSAMAGTFVVGTPADTEGGNCFPFGCDYNSFVPSGQFQQVYSSSLFSGPITITGLQFFNTVQNNGASAMNTGTFAISLSTTAADWNTMSTTPADNIGGDNAQVFNGSLARPWVFGDTLTILFSTPFTYTPGAGSNLLLNVVATGTGDAGGDIFFDTNGFGDHPNTFFGRSSAGFSGAGYGLVTGFSTSAPEPVSFVLLIAGLLGLPLLRKRVS
jgi:hypothetical protein